MAKSVWVCYTDQDGEFRPTICKIFSTEEKAKAWVEKSEAIDLTKTVFSPYYSFRFFYNECAVDDDGTVCCAVHEMKEK